MRKLTGWIDGFRFLFSNFLMAAILLSQSVAQENLVRYVDPFIGTGFHGHVFLGANIPFGGVQLGPVNLSTGWDWCSGYHYSDSTIIGFAHTHLSGTGIGDLGDILFMPVVGKVKPVKGVAGKPASGYYSLFSHKEEKAVPGYYSVRLQRYDILAELTATARTGFHRYHFPASDSAAIIIDLKEGIADRPVETLIEKINDSTITGYRFSRGWAADQHIYFAAVFSKPFKQVVLVEDSIEQPGHALHGVRSKSIVYFSTTKDEIIQVKVGISPVSINNAMENIKAESPGWQFERVAAEASALWNKELNKIVVTASDTARLRSFYSAFYHTMIAPSIYNDNNGDYRGADKLIHRDTTFTNLTTFSLWDTYRAAHPLFTLTQPRRVNDMVNTMLAIFQQQDKLPVWHLVANETNTMPGNSGVQVVADAYLKGFHGFDTALAWRAVSTTNNRDDRGLSYVKKYGFIPADSMVESVAMGLEYAISDRAIAAMAKRMNLTTDYAYFNKRAGYYKNYYDRQAGFMRGRVSEKSWRTPFSPFQSRHMKDDFAEGNAWQYTWLVPQDVPGLISLLGGEKKFIKKLDSLFIIKGDLGQEASADITGLIGQYAHGNEPSHHIIYLYAYVGEPWKTAEKSRTILDSLYADTPAGLSGNEDVGQMSAWYILSSIGFYQVNPADGKFVFGSPVMDEVTLSLEGGKKFHMLMKQNNHYNKYIQRIQFNGKAYTKSYIQYSDIMAGGEMIIEMGNKPSSTWGIKPGDRPQ